MNILMIAYFYPPKGGGGVQRTLKFVKHLSNMGHNVHVLTVRSDDKIVQDSENTELWDRVIVNRTQTREITLLKKLSKAGSQYNKESIKKSGLSKIYSLLRSYIKKIILDIYNMKYVPDDK